MVIYVNLLSLFDINRWRYNLRNKRFDIHWDFYGTLDRLVKGVEPRQAGPLANQNPSLQTGLWISF